jgi:hypothetical protein
MKRKVRVIMSYVCPHCSKSFSAKGVLVRCPTCGTFITTVPITPDSGELDTSAPATPLNAGLSQLRALPNLTRFSASCTSISDSGVRTLANSPELTHLDLSFTHVTDEGIQYLRHLAHLRVLDLTRTDVSDQGLEMLSAALPGCEIRH